MNQLLPYRSQQKVKALVQRHLVPPHSYYQPIPKYIAKKQRPQQEYMHIHGERTWLVDVAFIASHGEVVQAAKGDDEALKRECKTKYVNIILICLHANSRVVCAARLPNRTAKSIANCLKWLSQRQKCPCDTVISDADESIAKAVKMVPNIKNHVVYSMSAPATTIHTALALIDRFTRTFRDMLFNSKLTLTNNDVLRELIQLYNNTPHATLSRIMGFDVTPDEMISNIDLQHEFMR